MSAAVKNKQNIWKYDEWKKERKWRQLEYINWERYELGRSTMSIISTKKHDNITLEPREEQLSSPT